MNILKEDKNKTITTTCDAWMEINPIIYVYTDSEENWYFSDKEEPIKMTDDLIDGEWEMSDSFLATVEQILQRCPSLKDLPTVEPGSKIRLTENGWEIIKE